jgi:tRNA dimethylallyltransferase
MIKEIENAKEKYNLSFEYLESLGLEFKWTAKFLQNKISKEEMIENLKKEIYQYARRQETWFKRYNF